jgi:hypothetical protein
LGVGSLIKRVAAGVEKHGLIPRSGFDFIDGDERPAGPSGMPAASVLLVGSAGAAWWRDFQIWTDRQPDVMADPLDNWTREIVGRVAGEVGARLVMPNDRPFAPFQQWAMRAEGLEPSPIGLLMHPAYGLWHAYRAALLFDDPLPRDTSVKAEKPIHLCDACVGKPCLKACPVGAHSEAGFAHQDCLDHVRGPEGAPCRTGGCLDRNACPYGTEWRYPAEVQAFFQRAFAKLP